MASKNGSMPPTNPSSWACACGGTNCPMCNVVSEMQAYARPEDYGTSPELARLMTGRGVQMGATPMIVFPNPDPDHDGDSCESGVNYPGLRGIVGVTDYKGGIGPDAGWLDH